MLNEKDLEAIGTIVVRSENLILDEIARTQEVLEEKIKAVQRNLDEVKQLHQIRDMESSNTTILLQMIDTLNKRVSELENKIA